MEEVLVCPSTPEEWEEKARDFQEVWNFPHAIGAIDGKHIRVKCPLGGGSEYYNYKGFHSILMLAVADASYKFTYVDLGGKGANSDAQVNMHCKY